MSTYTKTTNFTAKDNLTSGDPAKVIKGSEFDTEFNSIETAVNSKADANNGTHTGTTTISTADIDTLQIDSVEVTATSAELNTLDGITSTTAELNKLDGFTGTVDDLNYAKDLRATGVTSAELDKIDGLTADSTELNILDGATVTTAELNTLDGITASTAELNVTDGLTATTAELNTLDGITSTTAELNVLDGITATTAELNVLDGVTSTTAEINKLDGFTGTVADLNYAKDLRATGVTTTEFDKLDGLTATTTELNYTDGVTSNIQTQLDSMVEKAGDTMTGDLSLGDNVKAKFGASDDLQIYHDGSHSYVRDSGTGHLKLQGTDIRIQSADGGENFLVADLDGAVRLYNDNTQKLQTTSTGVTVTGEIVSDGLSLGDNDKATFGASDDLQIYHDGSASYIADTGSGTLNIKASGSIRLRGNDTDELLARFNENGSNQFYYDNAEKLATTSTGVDVTGTITADGLTVDGAIEITGNQPALALKELDTTDSDVFLRLNGGNFNIETRSDAGAKLGNRITADSNGDVKFYENTGTTAKMVWDASSELLILNSPSGINLGDTTGDGVQLSGDDIRVKRTCTTTTQGLLHLNNIGVQGNVAEFYIDGVQTGAIGVKDGAAMTFISGTGNTERMRINSSGNVGIGTASPERPLHIASATPYIVLEETDANQKFTLGTGGGKFFLYDETDSAQRITVDTSGNVGIGRTNPSSYVTDDESLYVKGQIRVDGITNTASVPALAIDDTNSGIFSPAANTLGFSTAAAERARIDSSGNLLVGTTSSGNISSAHEIRGSSTSGGNSILTVNNTSGTAECPSLNVANRDTSTDSTNRFVQFYADYTGSTATAMGGIVGNGSGAVQFASISDERVKENITPVASVSDKIKDLNIVEFDFIETGDHVNYGFIAQNVEGIFPEFVVDNMANAGEEARKGLAGGMASGYVAVLTKALQEALTRIEQLETRIETLENN